MLPGGFATSSSSGRWGAGRLPEFAQRALRHDQMEFDAALSQMWALLTNPQYVSKISKARKMTKNHYHRDDPAFLVLQLVFLAVVTTAYGIATASRPAHIVYEVLYQTGINYLTLGALFSTAAWVFANRFMMASGHLHEVRRDMEWQHSFDVHCNSYVVYFAWTQVAPYVLLPLLLHDGITQQFMANALYCIGVCAYCYTTFHGYLELPTLVRQHTFLYPAIVFTGVVILMTLTTNINLVHYAIRTTWPSYV
jgi:hypothetical protein